MSTHTAPPRRLHLTLTVLALIVAATLLAIRPSTAAAPKPDIPQWVTRPCQSEDSVNCRWIATGPHHQGTGGGHTFVVRQLPGPRHLVCTFFAQHRYAKAHDHCTAGGR